MATERKKTVSKTTAPKRVKTAASQTKVDAASKSSVTTDDGVTTNDEVTTHDDTILDESVTTNGDVIVDVEDRDTASDRIQLVAQRAYARYEARGYADGHDLEDWLSAEAEV